MRQCVSWHWGLLYPRHYFRAVRQAISRLCRPMEGDLKYEMSWKDELMIDSSVISLFADARLTILDAETRSADTTWNPVWGQFNEIRDLYNELVLTLDWDERRQVWFYGQKC